ncbi:hypothetical protein RFI_29460, partial [Reticulomyxa filosa]
IKLKVSVAAMTKYQLMSTYTFSKAENKNNIRTYCLCPFAIALMLSSDNNEWKRSHDFALNGNEWDQEVHCIYGIEQVYTLAIKQVKLYGQTLFQPILPNAIAIAIASAAHSNVKNKIQYFTLLILADEVINHFKETKDLCSCIFAKRDIVQFALLRDYSKPLKDGNGHIIGFTDTLRRTFQRKVEENSMTIYDLYKS